MGGDWVFVINRVFGYVVQWEGDCSEIKEWEWFDASVWDLRDERRVRKFRLFDGERVKGFDRATYTLRGLAIGGSGRLVGVSNTNRVHDATMQLVRGR